MSPWADVAVAAVVGAVVGVTLYARGERARFESELAPIRVSIAEVADAFEHWTKRERRRGHVQKTDEQELTRQEQLREVARRLL